MKRQPVTTAQIVAVLKTAGLSAAILTKRERRSGFSVRKINKSAVSVQWLDWESRGDRAEQFDRALAALQNEGYTLGIGFGADHISGTAAMPQIRENGIAMVYRA